MGKIFLAVFVFCVAGVVPKYALASAEQLPAKIGVFQQEIAKPFGIKEGLPSLDILHVSIEDGRPVAYTPQGATAFDGSRWVHYEGQIPQRFVLVPHGANYMLGESNSTDEKTVPIRQCAFDKAENIAAVATEIGLFVPTGSQDYVKLLVEDGQGRQWGNSDVRAVAIDSNGKLWFAVLAGVVQETDAGWQFYTGAEGLPYNDFTCMAAGTNGVMWFGTKKGVIRYNNGKWHYRQGKRWLPNDEVRDIAVDEGGNAWVATPEGIGFIGFVPMTLEEKAAFYEDEIEKYIKRTPFGYTSEVRLAHPGDKSSIIYTDSDNDGLWTAMYGASQCFAYAATGKPQAKENAQKAFEALRFLQKVTQTGEIRPPKGFVARTILSTDGPDPNEGRIEKDIQHREERDRLWKVYEPRWPKSGDGKWYWKSDTSSDELDGHYFFYPAYYDYVAETEEEKAHVREVVQDLTDHLIDHGFNLVDFDGTPTRWGVYNPDTLNNNPDWWVERGLKSLSMLSYLAVAEHIVGNPKYGEASRELIEKHHYLTNAMIYKIHFGPGSGNQSDDEMAFMCYYNLLKYTKDETVRHQIAYSFFSAWINEQPEMNPLFNFMYAAVAQDARYRNPWGEFRLAPWRGWLEDAIETLLDFPLNRVGWGHQNSHRLDILRLPRQQSSEPYEPHRPHRGYRVNGKVLPVSERFFHHWNTDPWNLDYSGEGHTLGSGTVFLLPYYLGLYHQLIEN